MPYVKTAFDKIITLAIDTGKGAPKMRATPENADCYNVAATGKTVSRYLSKAKGVMNYVKGSEYYDVDTEADTAQKKLFLEYFCARADREFKLCMDKLKDYDFSKFDSVTVYSYWFFVAAMIGTKIRDEIKKQCRRVKLVSRAHGYDVYENRREMGYLPLRAYLLNNFDAVYVCSEDGRRHIAEKYPVFAHRVHRSYLGTVDNGICNSDGSSLHIVSCSHVIDVKRVNRLASALSLLKDKGIDIKWTHIGDGELMPEMKKTVEEKLSFMEVDLKGSMSNTDVFKFYRKNPVDLFINVSSSEGLPVSIMEAISFGIPVIATDVGGVREIVRTNFNGKLIPSDFSDSDLAFEISKFNSLSREEKQKLRRNARSYWEENFNAEKNYSEFVKKII